MNIAEVASKREGFKEQNSIIMSKKSNSKSKEFLYANSISKRSNRKINVIEVKPNATKRVIDPPKKGKRNPTSLDVLTDFLESTSVHGLQYFGKTDIEVGTFGKILWSVTIFSCFIGLSLMVVQFLHRYNENPTNTYILTFDEPIFKAPFPAVTICPTMPIPMRKRLAILENAILPENVSREFALNILKYGHIITHPYTSKEFEEIDKLKAFLNANKWKVVEFVKILINCEDIFESCQWNTEQIDCGKSIKTSYSSYGLCCSFNYLLEGYMGPQSGQATPKPLGSADFGPESGLKLVINKEFQKQSDEEDSYNSMNFSMNNNGIMVVIHDRMDFPGLSSNMYMLQANHELKIAIKPELIQKPKGLQHRNKENQLVPICIAEDQNTLEYFSIYGYSNCYTNCRVKAMLRYCGCLPFIFNNVAEYNKIKHCELDRLHCIQKNKRIRIVKNFQSENVSCSCRTPCTYMNYDGFPNSITLMKTSSTRNVSQKSTILNVYMNSQTYQVSISLSAANETYLLASVGGIFSLFLGCSFLSVAEIIYFIYLFFRASLKSSQKRNLNTS